MLYELQGTNHGWMMTHADNPGQAIADFEKHCTDSMFLSIEEVRGREAVSKSGEHVAVIREKYLRCDDELILHYETEPGSWIPATEFRTMARTGKRNPTAIIRDRFKGKTQPEMIAEVLRSAGQPMTTFDLVTAIYDSDSTEELDRARNSLGAALRAELEQPSPRWQKLGRTAYVAVRKEAPVRIAA